MDYLSLGLRLFLAFVCLIAVSGKVRGRLAFAEFGRLLEQVGVPAGRTTQVGLGLVLTELAVAALTPWRATALAGSAVAVGLFAVLTTGVGLAVRRGVAAPCRCFGRAGGTLGRPHVVRNATLTTAAIAALASVPGTGGTPGSAIGTALAATVAAVATALIVYWDDLATLVAADLVEVRR
jgi:hypothetical protein